MAKRELPYEVCHEAADFADSVEVEPAQVDFYQRHWLKANRKPAVVDLNELSISSIQDGSIAATSRKKAVRRTPGPQADAPVGQPAAGGKQGSRPSALLCSGGWMRAVLCDATRRDAT